MYTVAQPPCGDQVSCSFIALQPFTFRPPARWAHGLLWWPRTAITDVVFCLVKRLSLFLYCLSDIKFTTYYYIAVNVTDTACFQYPNIVPLYQEFFKNKFFPDMCGTCYLYSTTVISNSNGSITQAILRMATLRRIQWGPHWRSARQECSDECSACV